jgi:hypothetical protein
MTTNIQDKGSCSIPWDITSHLVLDDSFHYLMTHLDSVSSIWFCDFINSHNDSLESLLLISDYI